MFLKRLIDLFICIIFMIFSIFIFILITILIKTSSPGPIIHWSRRIGKNNQIFYMPKFRTMLINTPEVATHLLKNSNSYITFIGKFLRKYSLDELPQIISVLKNDMSIVGPRPALFNQKDLMKLRTINNIHLVKPGITGWAQINGRDEISIQQKVEFEIFYLKNQSFMFDIQIIIKTMFKEKKKKGVSH